MKRPVIVMLLCLLAGALAWWRLHGPGTIAQQSPEVSAAQATPPVDTIPSAAANVATATALPSTTPPPTARAVQTGPRHKRAYMLSLDQGALAFLEAQDIEGDFAPKRGTEEVWSNMLRCRLMSETNAVLAEELLPAPDQVCQVLDPRVGAEKPVNFTNPGPVIFQVRLPRVKDASRLDIFRILQPGEPAVENLLGSIPLPRQ